MSEISKYNLKDTSREKCEFCDLTHERIVPIEGYGDFKARHYCDLCINTERSLGKIEDVLQKTLLLLRDTPNGAKFSETRTKLEKLLEMQKNKRIQLIQETRRNLQGRSNPNKTGSPRMPYKET